MTEENKFEFIKHPEKMQKLNEANNLLNITRHPQNNKLVFVYSAPKVGSTSIVSSLRLFGIDKVNVIHIHDEEMLKVLAHITDVTVNEIILFNIEKCTCNLVNTVNSKNTISNVFPRNSQA